MTHYPDLWTQAYGRIYANKGALTHGVTDNTMDGMCEDRIKNLIKTLKEGRFRPKPVRRAYIPKKNGKRRPLGVPTGDEKLVQEVVRMLLERIYEPVFSDKSHGFRPHRSCHTALIQIKEQWKGIKWAVDMDISSFYDNIDHCKMIEILEKKIDDRKFIKLIKNLLQAGYLENWKFHGTYSGTPQGAICSPVLANIFLHELDEFMDRKMEAFNRGRKRRYSSEYLCLSVKKNGYKAQLRKLQKNGGCFPFALDELSDRIKRLEAEQRKISSVDPSDENYRKLQYVRYADDFVIGVIGSKSDAERTAQEVTEFLINDLKLSISAEKSGIRHVKKGFDFLGYHLSLNCKSSM